MSSIEQFTSLWFLSMSLTFFRSPGCLPSVPSLGLYLSHCFLESGEVAYFWQEPCRGDVCPSCCAALEGVQVVHLCFHCSGWAQVAGYGCAHPIFLGCTYLHSCGRNEWTPASFRGVSICLHPFPIVSCLKYYIGNYKMVSYYFGCFFCKFSLFLGSPQLYRVHRPTTLCAFQGCSKLSGKVFWEEELYFCDPNFECHYSLFLWFCFILTCAIVDGHHYSFWCSSCPPVGQWESFGLPSLLRGGLSPPSKSSMGHR